MNEYSLITVVFGDSCPAIDCVSIDNCVNVESWIKNNIPAYFKLMLLNNLHVDGVHYIIVAQCLVVLTPSSVVSLKFSSVQVLLFGKINSDSGLSLVLLLLHNK